MSLFLFVDHNPWLADELALPRAWGYEVAYAGKNPILGKVADLWLKLDPVKELPTLLEGRLDLLRSRRVAHVYTIYEHAKLSQHAIASALGVPTLPIETLRLGRDKRLMRIALREAGLPTPDFHFIPDSEATPTPPLSFPFVLKPNLGYASGGVQIVRNKAGFAGALRMIRGLNRFVLRQQYQGALGALAEEFIDGPEYSVDSVTAEGETRAFCICGKGFPAEENFQDYVYYTPPAEDLARDPALQEHIGRALAAFGYRDGPSHTELRFDKRRKRWSIVETAFRVGFGGHIGRMQQELTGIPHNLLAMRSSMGMLSASELRELRADHQRYGVLFTPAGGSGGVVRKVEGTEWLSADPRIRHFNFEKKAGDTVVAYPKGLEYLGVVMGITDARADLERLIDELCQKVIFCYES